MPSVAVRVHHVGVHPSVRGPGVQPSGVQLSGVRTSGSLVSGPSVRPSGVQPVRRPACPGFSRPVPVRPPVASVWSRVSPAAALGGHLGTAGQSSCLERIEFHVVRPRPSGSVDGPGRPGCGHRCGGRVGQRGSVGRDLAGLCSGGWLRPTDQGGQTAARAPIASDCARQGCWLKRDVPAPAAWLPSWLERDYAPWLSWSMTPAWTGSAGPTSLTRGWARGPSAAQVCRGCSRLDASSALTCENGGGRDRV
jgi:hypothetical protein